MRVYHGQCVDLEGEVIGFTEKTFFKDRNRNIIIGSYPTQNDCIKQCLEWGGTYSQSPDPDS